jgi:hypothetical protein
MSNLNSYLSAKLNKPEANPCDSSDTLDFVYEDGAHEMSSPSPFSSKCRIEAVSPVPMSKFESQESSDALEQASVESVLKRFRKSGVNTTAIFRGKSLPNEENTIVNEVKRGGLDNESRKREQKGYNQRQNSVSGLLPSAKLFSNERII